MITQMKLFKLFDAVLQIAIQIRFELTSSNIALLLALNKGVCIIIMMLRIDSNCYG